jgi:hypothetical protein
MAPSFPLAYDERILGAKTSTKTISKSQQKARVPKFSAAGKYLNRMDLPLAWRRPSPPNRSFKTKRLARHHLDR